MSNTNGYRDITRSLQALLGAKSAVGYEKITVTGSAVGLTIPTGAKSCLVHLTSDATADAIRWRQDGPAPTSAEGIPQRDGDKFEFIGLDGLGKLKFIATGADTNTLYIQYYK